jgi:hypothetical protein
MKVFVFLGQRKTIWNIPNEISEPAFDFPSDGRFSYLQKLLNGFCIWIVMVYSHFFIDKYSGLFLFPKSMKIIFNEFECVCG